MCFIGRFVALLFINSCKIMSILFLWHYIWFQTPFSWFRIVWKVSYPFSLSSISLLVIPGFQYSKHALILRSASLKRYSMTLFGSEICFFTKSSKTWTCHKLGGSELFFALINHLPDRPQVCVSHVGVCLHHTTPMQYSGKQRPFLIHFIFRSYIVHSNPAIILD